MYEDDGIDDVYTDPLIVGMTRPATVWGIPYTAFVIEFMSTAVIFTATGNPIYLLIGFPLHGILYLISANNPNAFAAIQLWVMTIGRCLNKAFWGAASFSPLDRKN